MHPNTRHELVYLPPSRAADTPPHIQEDTITTDSTRKCGTKTTHKEKWLILSQYAKKWLFYNMIRNDYAFMFLVPWHERVYLPLHRAADTYQKRT